MAREDHVKQLHLTSTPLKARIRQSQLSHFECRASWDETSSCFLIYVSKCRKTLPVQRPELVHQAFLAPGPGVYRGSVYPLDSPGSGSAYP